MKGEKKRGLYEEKKRKDECVRLCCLFGGVIRTKSKSCCFVFLGDLCLHVVIFGYLKIYKF